MRTIHKLRFGRLATAWMVVILCAGAMVWFPAPAQAHWCTNIWDTPARIVVKPERDTIFVGDTIGDVEYLIVWVQNNFPYTISGVRLTGDNNDFTVSSVPNNVVIQSGENKRFELTLTRVGNSGDDNLYLQISVNTHFRENDIEDDYWTQTLPSQADIDDSGSQATHLKWAKYTELESTYPGAEGLQNMLDRYARHRLLYTAGGGYDGSWHVNQHPMDYDGFDFWMFDHAQAQRGLMDLAILHVNDPRLQDAYLTGMDDPMPLWRGLCAVLAAGFTPGTDVTTRLQTMATSDECVISQNCSNYTAEYSPSDDARMLAKAALIILGQDQYQTEVQTYCYGGNGWESLVCAAALGMAGQDAPVTDVLLPMSLDADSDLVYLFASYLVNVVAAHRRGPSGDGCVSFFDDDPNCIEDDTPPLPPENLAVQPAP